MAGLRTLLEIGSGGDGGVSLNFDTLYVYHSNKTSANNGGCCCLWTVPANVTWFAVEMWGGGAAGPGSCCCQQGGGGGAGSYARKFITATPGQQFTICAAGSTGCCCACCSQPGYPSFVRVNGGGIEACASGGASQRTRCFSGDGCGGEHGCQTCQCGSWTGSFGICGLTGAYRGNSTCNGNAWGYAASAPFTGGGQRGSRTWCSTGSGISQHGEAHWPGGGGGSAVTHGGSGCYGGPGAGGLVSIYYGATA